MQRQTILWTRSEEHAPIAQQWLRQHAPNLKLFLAPLQRYIFRPISETLPQLPNSHVQHWTMVITSVNGAQAALAVVRASAHAAQWLSEVQWLAVGPGTAAYLREEGVVNVIISDPPDVTGLVALLCAAGNQVQAVTVCAVNARPVLRQAAQEHGWTWCEIIGYEPQPLTVDLADVWPHVAAIPLASAATWSRLADQLPEPFMQDIRDKKVHLIAMGKHTAEAIERSGLPLAGQASEPTVPSLLQAVVAALS